MTSEVLDEKKVPEEAKKIQEEFYAELGTGTEANKPVIPGAAGTDSPFLSEDFISDDVMGVLLGYKNSYFVSVLAKGLGKTEEEMLRDLYQADDKELKLYKKFLQNFIRENFSEYVDKIAKFTNGELTAILIIESVRWKSAQDLLRASKDISSKKEKNELR
jgi:hypothetical protein